MIITRDGERYDLVGDEPIEQDMPAYGAKAVHRIKVSNPAKTAHHIALGVSRDHCLKGLLDSGFTIKI